MFEASIFVAVAFTVDMTVSVGLTKGSRQLSASFSRRVRAEIEVENIELDRRISDPSRELATKLSLSPEQADPIVDGSEQLTCGCQQWKKAVRIASVFSNSPL